jgi:hypothetical protein
MAKVSKGCARLKALGCPAQAAKQVNVLRHRIGRLGRDRHQADRPKARGKPFETGSRATPFVAATGTFEIVETTADAVEKGFAQLRNQLGFVTHCRRQSRIDCTRIISHACISTGKRLRQGFAIRFPQAEIMVNS